MEKSLIVEFNKYERIKSFDREFEIYKKALVHKNDLNAIIDEELNRRICIRDTIRKNINVQIGIANFFTSIIFRPRSSGESRQVKIGLLNDDLDSGFEMLTKVFDKFSIVQQGDKKFCFISNIDQTVIDSFFELRKEGQINKWLDMFTLKGFENDHMVIYDKFRYDPDHHIADIKMDKIVDSMKSDPYFRYFLDEDINIFDGKIAIPGFTIEEIARDKNIFAFSKTVSALYIEIIDGFKFLTWDV